MASILTSLLRTVVTGFVLAFILFILYAAREFDNAVFWPFLFRWLHVLSGIMWVGLLWYLNFVQIPNMGKIPDDQKPAISKVIVPALLFWFRWAAMATLATGLILAALNGYLADALTLGWSSGALGHTMIGIGMWLGILLWVNVWFVIWPAQKKVLGLVPADAAAKAAAARTTLLVSRANTALTVPMLFAMVSAQNLFGAS
jgi:uncharacterized membrane protein